MSKKSPSVQPGVQALTVADLRPAPYNPRKMDEEAGRGLEASLQRFGDIAGLVYNRRNGHLVAGHQRMERLRVLYGEKLELREVAGSNGERLELVAPDGKVWGVRAVEWDDATEVAANLAANNPAIGGEFDADKLPLLLDLVRDNDADLFDQLLLGELAEIEGQEREDGDDGEGGGVDNPPMPEVPSMAERFVVPPFSVLDARGGAWRERKAKWKTLGLGTPAGRGQELTFNVSGAQTASFYKAKGAAEQRLGRKLSWQEAYDSPEAQRIVKLDTTSVFDPVLCEVAYRWFCPPGGRVLDPFAGGPVRGVVAALLGRAYTGLDLREEQVTANAEAWERIAGMQGVGMADDMPAYTRVDQAGDVWLKRDDTFSVAGVRGGKVRTCWNLAQGSKGLVTAGSRASPQVQIVAHVAERLGVPCRVHTPTGEASEPVADAVLRGAERVEHTPGHNSVIIARSREDAKARGWTEIPFGMECQEAVEMTAQQVCNLPEGAKRIVIPVGSGMTLAGVLHGLQKYGRAGLPVLGVVVGADPEKRLDKWAPKGWRDMVTLVPAGVDYHQAAAVTEFRGVQLDPIYEAKCIPHVQPGDVLWVVGRRGVGNDTLQVAAQPTHPKWVHMDSRMMGMAVGDTAGFDFVFSCPPYADLEVYSDSERDLSNMAYADFLAAYRDIVAQSYKRLADDRFAVFVVGDVRDKKTGLYRNFVADTIAAFMDAGFGFYNQAVIVSPVGSATIRAGRPFVSTRKITLQHQHLLVFVKGDPRRAAEATPVGQLDVADPAQWAEGEDQEDATSEALNADDGAEAGEEV